MFSAGQVCFVSSRKSLSIRSPLVKCLFDFNSGLDALAFLLVWLFVPGTERQVATMEEMNYVFGVATRRHLNYQLTEVAPWCLDHYVRRRRGVDLEPLYRYALTTDNSNDSEQEGDSGTQGGNMNGGISNGHA